MNYLKSLIRNSTGDSIKSFTIFSAIVIAAFHLICVWVLIFLSFSLQKDVPVSLTHISILLGTIEGILLALLGVKVWSEKYERTPKEV